MNPAAASEIVPVSDDAQQVLIVDDEESIRKYVDRVLSMAGYRTIVAADCTNALVIARQIRVDLLLTDVMMPEMTGAALAAKMREKDPDLKVLYLTGYADRLFDERWTLGGKEAFLEKPCTAAGLRQAVSMAITGRLTTGVSTEVPAL
jgi:two-component system, cell cycle sensor histidine kinase and response regulator CckA